jgi:hypothetical protein
VVDSDTGAYERIPGRRLALVGVALVAAAGAVGTFLVAIGLAGAASADGVTDPPGRNVPPSAMAGWVDPDDRATASPGPATVPPGLPPGAATPRPGETPLPLPGASPVGGGAPADGIAAVGPADDTTPDGITPAPAPAASGPAEPDGECRPCDRDAPGQDAKSTARPTSSPRPDDGRPLAPSNAPTFTSADALSPSTSDG